MEERMYQIVTHEEASVERALDLLEHERVDQAALDDARGYEVKEKPQPLPLQVAVERHRYTSDYQLTLREQPRPWTEHNQLTFSVFAPGEYRSISVRLHREELLEIVKQAISQISDEKLESAIKVSEELTQYFRRKSNEAWKNRQKEANKS